MKLHLNLSLRRALLAAMAAVATFASTATAGVMHSDATYQTYTDFGQNCGRYVVGSKVNALLSHIRAEEGGITIDYTDGSDSYLISNEQGMISFNGTHDSGHSAVISPTFIATVLHNGSLDGSFSARTVGSSHAINYEAIDIRGSKNFRLAPSWGDGQYDYMLQRQSKVVTDVTWNQLTSLTYDQIENLDGGYIYHSGSGTMYQWDEDNEKMVGKADPYSYIIGAINGITNGQVHADGKNISIHQNPAYIPNDGASTDNPLPNGIRPGDSGSPTFIYNASTGKYEYIAAQQSAGAEAYGQARGNVEWTQKMLTKFDANIDMSETSTIHLSAIDQTGETISEIVGSTEYKTTLHSGIATDANGNEVGSYIGVKTGISTWADLSGRKNINNWYAYENKDYTWGSPTYGQVISDLKVSDADLFYTQNLVFTPSQASSNIVLDATVDLGIGYAEFNKGESMDKAKFYITAQSAGTMFNHAGYVVNEGAEVHLRLTNPEKHMTEWRKIGTGDLYIDGTGDTNALLNVGGNGKTYLSQTGGHAAYNVLVNSGATVVIKNTSQIERDLTFGAGGGALDMNGNDMEWYTTGGESREGSFTIQALTEEAMITNTAGQVTLTYKQGGNTTYKGSFSDSATGSLHVVYDGGGTWTLNSIHTDLTSLSNSGFKVNSGKVILSGTNTVHGMGSATATNTNRLQLENDWHYADAAMGTVEVVDGATFELGSHARLTGQMYLYNGGTFIIREAVKHQYEYVEGGSTPEDTYQYADYYGYKGVGSSADIYLGGSNAALRIEYSEGTTANTTIDASISGKGSVSVDTGLSGGTLTLAGNNSMSGTKTIVSGGLIADSATALGNTTTNKWKIQEKGWLVSHVDDGATLLGKIDSSSAGVLALSGNTTTQLDLSGHKSLYVGAETGKTIEYGEKGTSTELVAQNGAWRLGGGGGTLNVNFLLTGENDLIIGNTYSSGTVHLANNGNTFSGDIIIMGTGNILTYESKSALGNAHVALSYGNTLALHSAGDLHLIKADTGSETGAEGILAAVSSFDLDMSNYSIALGAVGDMAYTGTLTVDAEKGYRFGGNGNLTLDTALEGSDLMYIDGQGNEGSSVTLAQENAFSGSIVAGGKLNADNSAGSIGIYAGHAETYASLASMELQKGATLCTDGHSRMVVQNLTAQTGARITNSGSSDSTLELHVTTGSSTTIEDGVLVDAENASLSLLKTGQGTLSMKANKEWSGGLTIREGQVNIHAGNGGVGANSNTIHIEEGGTLRVDAFQGSYTGIGNTILRQHLSGTGTIEAASGSSMLLTQQAAGFEGTVRVTNNTRLYVGTGMTYNTMSLATYNNAQAFDKATIQVTSGSQVRLTSNLLHVSETAVTSAADYIIAGNGMAGHTGTGLVQDALNTGALSIDCGATITGNVTLADNATIASWSKNVVDSKKNPNSTASAPFCWYRCNNGSSVIESKYGIKDYLGGTIRGQILGEGKNLTIAGTEGMTFTADAASTYGDLLISNANGNNTDKFALRLDGGKAVSQTSTALGKGNVTLNDGLILRLAGTGVANQADVVYTYANNISAGDNATIQSYNITNKLTGTVNMADTLNLFTANGGVLELAGNIAGNGNLHIGSGSSVVLSGSQGFGGALSADAGASLTLASTTVLSADSEITGSSTLHLNLKGTADFTLGNITVNSSEARTATTLNLCFDFTDTPSADNSASWSSLTSSITADSTVIGLELNMFDDLRSGDYLLVTQAGSTTEYSLADTMGGRLSLTTNEDGAIVLHVGADDRLYWTGKQSSNWDSDMNWKSEKDGDSAYKAGAYVMLDSSEVDSAAGRETITLGSGETTVSTLAAQNSSYEISGEGRITGEQLLVGNKGDLKLSNTGGSAFSNGVRVDDARLEVSGGTLTANVTAENGADFTLSGNATMTGDMHLENADGTIQNSTINGNITTAGSGTLTLSAARMGKSHTMDFDAGTLTVTSDTTPTMSGTFSYAEGQDQLQVLGMSIAGGGLSSTAALKVDTLNISGGSLALKHAAGTTTEIGKITGNGSLRMESSGNLNLGNASVWGMTLLGGGTTTISGTVTLQAEALSIGKQTLNLVSGANVTTDTLTAGNTANDQPTQINIGAGASLTVTGSTDNDSTKNSFLLAHWGSSDSSLVLDGGTLTARNTSLLMGWDSSGRFEVLSGTANLKGIRFSTERNNSDTLLLGTAEGGTGRLNLGSNGITGIRSNDVVNLGNGTISATADFAISNKSGEAASINMVGTSMGTVFDTNGHTITVNTAIAGAGNIIKTGAGVLNLAGSGAEFRGNISVTEGALALNATSKDIFAAASSVTIGNATLDLSAIDFSDPANAINLANPISFDANSTVAFGAMESGISYQIFSFTGGAAEGWYNLGLSNFTINGVSLADMGHASLSLSMNGTFSYTAGWELEWNGGNSGSWSTSPDDEAWLTTGMDAGASTPFSTGFTNGDKVTFTGDSTATLGSDIMVASMNVNNGTVVVKDAGSHAFKANAINVADEAHLQLRYTDANAAANNSITKLVLGDNASFSTYDEKAATAATTIGTLQLDGASASVEDAYHSGIYHIQTLTLGDELASSTLNLVKDTASTNVTVFQLGSSTAAAGNFAGSINLTCTAESTHSRPAAIIISNKDIAANAVINLSGTKSSNAGAALALGINADNTTIAGLESGREMGAKAKLFSGSIGGSTSQQWNTSHIINASNRTLTINTAKGGDYAFHGEVMAVNNSKLNLVKDGEGTQRFLGSGSFGSVTVNAGLLELSGSMAASSSYLVAEDASLNINSTGTFSSTSGITKDGEGTMTVYSQVKMGHMLSTKAGEFVVAYTGADGNSINSIDGAMTGGNTANGVVRVAENASLTVGGWLWSRGNTGILLEEGAKLNLSLYNLSISNKGSETARFGGASTAGSQYSETNTGYEISNAHVVSTKSNGMTLGNKLTNSSVENGGSGTLTVSNSANTLTGIHATGGNVLVQGISKLELAELEIAERKNITTTGEVTVSTLAKLAEGATLIATNLTLESGATVELGGTFTLEGALTLGTGLTLSGTVLDTIIGLEMGESCSLFTGLSALNLTQPVTLQGMHSLTEHTMTTVSNEMYQVAAGNYFSNLGADSGFMLSYNGGTVSITRAAAIPEPTTATLSLLALSALAARRRRK